MSIYFSSDPVAFWHASIHREIPSHAVQINERVHQQMLAGQAAGKVIAADERGYPVLIDPPPVQLPVPEVISRFQARMALRNAGLFEAAEAAIKESADPLLTEAWDSAVEYRRRSPSILSLGADLGLDDGDIDQLFRAAAQITA